MIMVPEGPSPTLLEGGQGILNSGKWMGSSKCLLNQGQTGLGGPEA